MMTPLHRHRWSRWIRPRSCSPPKRDAKLQCSLEIIGELLASGESAEASGRPPLIVTATIRTDRYELMQTLLMRSTA